MRRILMDWFFEGGDEIPYLSTERAFLGGSGTYDYISFGGTDYDSNKRKYQAWRRGSDHNSAADADIILFASDYGSETLSSIITIRADVASYNYTNPNVFVGENNRVFVTYTKLRAQNNYELTGAGDVYFRYSDDIAGLALGSLSSATWSSEARLTTDYGELLTTSTTSINLNTITGGSVITPTIGTGLVGVVLGRVIKFASASDPTNKFFTATITAYDSGTGATSLTVIAKTGTTTHADWNVALTSYIDGPGKAIHLGAGELLKPVWVTTGGVSSVLIYRSTDNGENWTYRGLVTNDSINPCDETCIIKLPNGNIFASLRCNTLQVLRVATSSDGGATWSSLTNTTVDAIGKSPIAVTPSGRLFGISREPDGRTKYFYNTTKGNYTTFTQGYLDARTAAYIYGEVLYDNSGKFVIDWAVEAQNSTGYAGPTLLITKDIVFNQVDAPTSYDPDYQSLLDWAQINSETLPSTTLRTKQNTLVSSLRAAGKLDEIDSYFIAKHNDATLGAISKRDWKQSWRTMGQGGAPAYGVNGYDFDGVDDYLHTGRNLNGLTYFLLNTASITYYTDEVSDLGGAGVGLGVGDGTFSTRSSSTFLNPNSGGAIFCNINNGSVGSVAHTLSSPSLIEVQRTSSTNIDVYVNGVLVGSRTVTSTARATQPIYLGAEKFLSTINFYSTRGFGLLAIGGVKNSWYDEWAVYVASL